MGATKRELIDRIADSPHPTSRLTWAVVQAFLNEVIHELAQDNRIELRNFGVFEIRTTPARLARNPRTLEQILIPARRRAVFKPGRLLKSQMNGCLRQ
jgi:integration host factor subunit beta